MAGCILILLQCVSQRKSLRGLEQFLIYFCVYSMKIQGEKSFAAKICSLLNNLTYCWLFMSVIKLIFRLLPEIPSNRKLIHPVSTAFAMQAKMTRFKLSKLKSLLH